MISMGIVERLLRKNEDGSLGEITEADQYEAAERIKELEAERDHWKFLATDYHDKLTALRQSIADAPVVAWMLEQEGCSHKKLTWLPAVLDFCHSVPLISKEDLQK